MQNLASIDRPATGYQNTMSKLQSNVATLTIILGISTNQRMFGSMIYPRLYTGDLQIVAFLMA